jgi:hypothetical protein
LKGALCAALVGALLLTACGGQPRGEQQPLIRLSALEPLPAPAAEEMIP